MEYLIFAAVILGFIVLFMVKGFFDYKKSQKEFIRRLRKDYGVLPQKEYKPEKFENISHYFLKHQDGFVIDDITWNDLNMDDVFKRMNYTYSAAGEEYLYYLLRKPCCEEEARGNNRIFPQQSRRESRFPVYIQYAWRNRKIFHL